MQRRYTVRFSARSIPVVLSFLLMGICLSAGEIEAALRCNGCHGSQNTTDIRPVDDSFRNPSSSGFQGNHQTHMAASAVKSTCAKCHPGSDGYTSSHSRDSKNKIKVSSLINNSPSTTYYPLPNMTSAFPQSSNKTGLASLGECSNVNCHFEKKTPTWGNPKLDQATSNCNVCHGAPPSDGKHTKHFSVISSAVGRAPEKVCSKCHIDHVAQPDRFAHATSAGRPLSVQFTTAPNSGGTYTGDTSYPKYLPSQSPARNGTCNDFYCHSSGAIDPNTGKWGAPMVAPTWSGGQSTCHSCHKGAPSDSTKANCDSVFGHWSSGYCSNDLTMASNGHHKLVGVKWIRKYPCYYCHNKTVAENANNTLINYSSQNRHVNGKVDVSMPVQWDTVTQGHATYNPATQICTGSYCHSDGSYSQKPEDMRTVGWSEKTDCNSCHGHPRGGCNASGCHDGQTPDSTGKIMPVLTGWAPGSEWIGAMPMFANEGPLSNRPNSHSRHTQSNYSCDNCHFKTVVGACKNCHVTGIPSGSMTETAHVFADKHVNKIVDVDFKDGGKYNSDRTCENTTCHVGSTPKWGDNVSSAASACISCHKTTDATGGDLDSIGVMQNDIIVINSAVRAKINTDQWTSSGHGRYSTAGRYPVSGNPAANFPLVNPCWYCHDNSILHNDQTNPFRLRQHSQFNNRFEKECVYCHMQGLVSECVACHGTTTVAAESVSPQLKNITSVKLVTWANRTAQVLRPKHTSFALSSCLTDQGATKCHASDPWLHNSGAGLWTATQKADVKNQYVQMGVCLQCHDDDSGGQCNGCHDYSQSKYQLGFNPGTGLIKPKKARASSAHFGSKHYKDYLSDGKWRGGKFCWDCHDPHGDSNIYMIHDNVATTTDGSFGIPITTSPVVFKVRATGTNPQLTGTDYANSDKLKPYNGICNVCHTATSRHYQSFGGDGHNSGRRCTDCHQHRFADSHADGLACNSCHANSKPVPKHAAFTMPQDCIKCHAGTINSRMDIMGQFNGNSHHVQGVTVTNKQCYACHWEATSLGFIDPAYHEGYNLKNYTSVPNAKVDLVIWQAGQRPTSYNSSTATQFLASNMLNDDNASRLEAAKVTNHCLGCHSDQNNNTDPFGDCKTPRQYAWDLQSIAARYNNLSTTSWGKVNSGAYPVNKKDTVTKAFSAHGNAINNQGGFSNRSGIDTKIASTRSGNQNVQCYDCHSSHGSKVIGQSSSYVTFNGTHNGANLKETQAYKGGYKMSYKASSNTKQGAVNPYNAGAGQCFDCHNTQSSGTTPWGYQSTFGATAAIMGYYDPPLFGIPDNGSTWPNAIYPYKAAQHTFGGHMQRSGYPTGFLNHTTSTNNKINGLCTPCHDPHGVSPTLGAKRPYAVPLLKGTWMTSPYREDAALYSNGIVVQTNLWSVSSVYTDQKSLGTLAVPQTDTMFAGLCLNCHFKSNLTKDACSNPAFNNNSTQCKASATWKANTWKSKDRVHESVKGWKTSDNKIQHNYTCSKCHSPHATVLPRLMITDCLDWKHRGRQSSGGATPKGSFIGDFPRSQGGFNPFGPDRSHNGPRGGSGQMATCHPGANNTTFDNSWNGVTPWTK